VRARASSSRLGRFALLYLLAFVGGTGSRYGRTLRTFNLFGHSIIIADRRRRTLECVQLNLGVSVSNPRRGRPAATAAAAVAAAARMRARAEIAMQSSANCTARNIVASYLAIRGDNGRGEYEVSYVRWKNYATRRDAIVAASSFCLLSLSLSFLLLPRLARSSMPSWRNEP